MTERMARRLVAALAALCLLAPVAACGGADEAETTLTVLAAASLTDAFGDIRTAYKEQQPDVTLRFSFAGSQELAAQVRQGVPADVLATADEKTMKSLDRYVTKPHAFATNRLAIVVRKGNPKRIKALGDLARDDVSVVLAGPTVPAGRYARQALERAHVTVHPKSEPTDVRQVLTPVRLGEADAGIVYLTDVTDAGGEEVQAVPIPTAQNVVATYPVATLEDGGHTREATAFSDWLRSADARRILGEHGFGDPAES